MYLGTSTQKKQRALSLSHSQAFSVGRQRREETTGQDRRLCCGTSVCCGKVPGRAFAQGRP